MSAQILPAERRTSDDLRTATELARLDRASWAVRDDVAGHDHIVAGASVYILTTKNVLHGIVSIESGAPNVCLVDYPGATYRARPWIESAHEEACSLKQHLDAEAGFPVAVHPVIVLWDRFDAGREYVDDVSVVHGSRLIEWLESLPVDLQGDRKRDAIRRCVHALSAR